MGYKTILLHMGDDQEYGARLTVALALARRFGAHIDVLHVLTPTRVPTTGRGASAAFLAEAEAVERERAVPIAKELHDACKGIPHSFHAVDGDPVEQLSLRSVYADLAVVSEPTINAFEDRWMAQTADRLPAAAACPVVVVPKGHAATEIGRHVLLAWTPSRPASRALHDALPLMAQADRVTAYCGTADGGVAPPVEALRRILDRHEIKADVHATPDGSGDAGKTILDAAKHHGADMIVMGAYGHARWREILFGGTTRHVLTQSPVPVFVAR